MKLNFDDSMIDVSANGRLFTVSLADRTTQAEVIRSENGRLHLVINGEHLTAYVTSDHDKRWVTVDGRTFLLTKSSGGRSGKRAQQHAAGELTAPMPGQIRAVNVRQGDRVTKGQTLLVLEAMKMEMKIQAPGDGVISSVLVEAGQTVEREQILIEIAEN